MFFYFIMASLMQESRFFFKKNHPFFVVPISIATLHKALCAQIYRYTLETMSILYIFLEWHILP